MTPASRVGNDHENDPATRHLVVAWVVFVVSGIWAILAAMWPLTPWSALAEEPLRFRVTGTIFVAAWGTLVLATGLKIRAGRAWARWAGIVLGALAAAGNTNTLLTGAALRALGGAVFAALWVYVTVVLIRAGDHFRSPAVSAGEVDDL